MTLRDRLISIRDELAAVIAGLEEPTPPPPQANVLHVGANRPFTDLASALRAANDGNRIEMDAGTYAGAVIDKRVTVAAAQGARVVIKAPVFNDKFVSTVQVTGAGVLVEGLVFDSGTNWKAAAIEVNGTDTVIRNCHPLEGTAFYWFIKGEGYDGLTVDRCGRHKEPTQRYFVWSSKGGKRLAIHNCTAGVRIEHVIRIHDTQGVVIERNDFDASFARHVLNLRDGSDFMARDNKLTGGSAGTIQLGPLSNGEGLTNGVLVDPVEKAKRLRDVVIQGNTIKGDAISCVNLEMGLVNCTIEKNVADLGGWPNFISVNLKDAYRERGAPSGLRILDNKVTSTNRAPQLLKGDSSGVTAHGGNAINGKKVD